MNHRNCCCGCVLTRFARLNAQQQITAPPHRLLALNLPLRLHLHLPPPLNLRGPPLKPAQAQAQQPTELPRLARTPPQDYRRICGARRPLRQTACVALLTMAAAGCCHTRTCS